MKVLGLKGKARVGKSTAAQYLLNRGYERTSFAAPIKGMLAWLLEYQGVSNDTVERMITGDLKETPTPYLSGRSPREAMQMLGTEWGRSMHPDLWVNIWNAKVGDRKVAVDDMRFANEAAAVRAKGGYVIEIVPSKKDAFASVGISGHESERMEFDPDIVVVNDGKSLTRYAADLHDALTVLSQEAAD